MDRNDLIESRIDVIKNIYTLYLYTKSEKENEREWAIECFKRGKCFVVEKFGNKIIFAPSRFVGYKDNTIEKHTENHGDGRETNKRFQKQKLYKESYYGCIDELFNSFMESLWIKRDTPKFLIPDHWKEEDIKHSRSCFFINPSHCRGQKEYSWNGFISKGIMAIGWRDIDYSDYTIDKIIENTAQKYGDNPEEMKDAKEAFTCIKQIQDGDIICCKHNKFGLWGIGIAVSAYKYKQGIHYAGTDNEGEWHYSHYVDVAWLCFKEQGYIKTSELNIIPPEKQWIPYGTLSRKEIPQYIYNYLLKNNRNDMEQSKYQKYIDLLKANKNLILTGAPGTGKSYMAKKIAEEMNANVKFIQFHPSYDYTDFVEGLRPTPPDTKGNIGFERKDGVFKAFCKEAILNEMKPTQTLRIRPSSYSTYEKAIQALKEDLKNNGPIEIKSFRSSVIIKIGLNNKGNIANIKTNWSMADKHLIRYLEDGICHPNDTYTKTIGDYLKNNYIKEDTTNENVQDSHYFNEQTKFNSFEKEVSEEEKAIRLFKENLKNGHIQIQDFEVYITDNHFICVDKKSNGGNWPINEGNILAYLQTNKGSQYAEAIGDYIIENYFHRNVESTSSKYVFIIDEINRGEISKILGELFFCIDPGYRGKKGLVQTQYQNMITDENDPFYEGFYVPENVYIIGTMNDIDRSVESMDFATRRRFAWQEIKAEENTGMLDCLGEQKGEVVAKMNRLNKTIWDEEANEGIEGLNSAYHIGGAYFSKLKNYLKDNNKDAYKALWQNHLHGVLFEYLRGTANAGENMKKLKDAYDND